MISFASYPGTRLRRMRTHRWSRRLVQENTVTANDLIWPVFVIEGTKETESVASLPGVSRYSIDLLVEQCKKAQGLGIPMVALFPKIDPTLKTNDGEEAYNPGTLACRAIEAVKQACPDLGVMCDIALDLYTTTGQDGIVRDGVILNDKTIEALVKQSMCYANAGCDVLGPSDMMDGRVGAIRQALETEGYQDVKIFSYGAKYHSALYGPYRDAVGSGVNLGGASKATYQQHPANGREALREVAMDIAEGADALIVKPGTFYLDVIADVKREFGMPTIAYHVSGEYAMIQAAAQQGWIDGGRVLAEAMVAFKRAGCDGVITYGAMELAQGLDTGTLLDSW